jgi:hypothetical protein
MDLEGEMTNNFFVLPSGQREDSMTRPPLLLCIFLPFLLPMLWWLGRRDGRLRFTRTDQAKRRELGERIRLGMLRGDDRPFEQQHDPKDK